MDDSKSAEVQSLIRTIQVPAISKAALQSICAVNGIPKTGNKTDLQRRIIQCKWAFFGSVPDKRLDFLPGLFPPPFLSFPCPNVWRWANIHSPLTAPWLTVTQQTSPRAVWTEIGSG